MLEKVVDHNVCNEHAPCCDSSRQSAESPVMPATAVTRLITDRKLAPDLMQQYRNLGVVVDQAE